jgi:hypothetical protein
MTKQLTRTSLTHQRTPSVATIPTPALTSYAEARVTDGHRTWLVRDYADSPVVTPTHDPAARPMRACGLRDRILSCARAGV